MHQLRGSLSHCLQVVVLPSTVWSGKEDVFVFGTTIVESDHRETFQQNAQLRSHDEYQ